MSAKDIEGSQVDDVAVAEGGEEEAAERLNLDVQIASPSACERHVTVTVSREDVDRYLDEAYSELMASASVPGFRIGRAPRKLVENRFKEEIGEKIKGSLLMDSLSQISEEQSFTPISELADHLADQGLAVTVRRVDAGYPHPHSMLVARRPDPRGH